MQVIDDHMIATVEISKSPAMSEVYSTSSATLPSTDYAPHSEHHGSTLDRADMSGPPPKEVRRFRSADLGAALEQFARPELLSAGKINVIALDAIVERLGERWPARSEHVHRHVQAVLERQLGLQAYSLRVSDTDILVCQPQLGRLAAQASCIRLLREILRYFLGEIDLPEIDVHEVTSLSTEGVEARRVNEREALAASANEDVSDLIIVERRTGDLSPIGPLEAGAAFAYVNGRRVHLHGRVTKVIELQRRCVIGARISKRVVFEDTGGEIPTSELTQWRGVDRLELNVSAIETGLRLLDTAPGQARPRALIVPVALSSLATTDGRMRMIRALKAARGHAIQGVICELRHVEGVPAATLVAAIAAIRPFALIVIANVESMTRMVAGPLETARLNGVSLECPPNLDQGALVAWTQVAVANAKRIAKSVLLYEMPRDIDVSLIAGAGATHAAFTESAK